ncbi:MAG: hypothetical protein WD468_08845 [Pirellulales bacterium]
MSERRSFFRKIGYAIAIMVLLFPLAWLSMPATSREPGGQLARLRTEYGLGQSNLGEIDPASETMKLATLGLRGVAVNFLWEKANYFKKVEDWDNLSATLNQLANLQPNVITFWKFQAWNLSYNVSVEFDDYHDRYAKVIEGINFLTRGVRYNVGNAQLLWDMGWFLGQKIGRADEHVQYRRLFKEDDDFHPADRPQDQRDNWLVGKEWYEKGIEAVNQDPKRLGRKSPRLFFEGPAKSQINYSEAIEEEGYFDKARRAWLKAGEEWRLFGQVPIEHSTGVILKLGDKAMLEKEVATLRAELDGLMPGVRAKLEEEKHAALTPEERTVLDTPAEKLAPEQAGKLYEIKAKVEVTDREVADRIARDVPDKANQALRLASELQRQDTLLTYTTNYRRDSNYDFWENTCNFEPTQNAIDARRDMYNARKAFLAADVATARKLYKSGFEKWKLVIEEFPMIVDDESTTGDDLLDYVKHYRDALAQDEETIPDDFPLWDVIEKFDREQNFTEELATHKKHQADATGKRADQQPAPAPATESPGAKGN